MFLYKLNLYFHKHSEAFTTVNCLHQTSLIGKHCVEIVLESVKACMVYLQASLSTQIEENVCFLSSHYIFKKYHCIQNSKLSSNCLQIRLP